jgi:hypothetical protein
MSEYYAVAFASPAYYLPPQPESACSGLLRLASVGAVVGASAAAAGSYRRLRKAELSTRQALVATGKAAVVGGVATALAGAVAGTVSEQGGLTRLGLMLATGATAYYALGQWLEGDDA